MTEPSRFGAVTVAVLGLGLIGGCADGRSVLPDPGSAATTVPAAAVPLDSAPAPTGGQVRGEGDAAGADAVPQGRTRPDAAIETPALAVQRSWRRVVLDAGHGGQDEGAIGVSGIHEKDLALAAAEATARALRARGFQVVMTRERDEAVPLGDRAAIANASGAGLFVSLHANAAGTPQARGVETYSADLATDEAAMRFAERENRVARIGERGAGETLLDELRMGGTAELSRALARSVQEQLIDELQGVYGERIADRGAKRAPFWVLVDTEVPAILVEVGYVTHPDEERRIRTAAYQVRVGEGVARGVQAFVERMESAGEQP